MQVLTLLLHPPVPEVVPEAAAQVVSEVLAVPEAAALEVSAVPEAEHLRPGLRKDTMIINT